MARRAPPGHRLPIEAQLARAQVSGSGTLLDALHDFARVLGVEPVDWQVDPALQLIGETTAAALMLREILGEDVRLSEAAILTVAVRLGLNEKSLDARLRRAESRERSRGADAA